MHRLRAFLKKNWLAVFLAIVPPFMIWYFWQRESFELSTTVLVDVPVVSVQEEFGDQIGVLFKGEPVDGIRVVELEVANIGTRPLDRSAFDSPLTFDFSSEWVTEPVVVRTHPRSLRPQFETQSGKVLLQPLLLNPGDSFAFRSLVIGSTEESLIQLSGRVRGVSDLHLLRTRDGDPVWPAVFRVLAILVSILSLVRLGVKVARLRVRLPLGVALELAERLEEDPRTRAKASQLAQDLDIPKHDEKAYLLFVRLRIESLLRELARQAGLLDRVRTGSIRHLAERLVSADILPRELNSAIADISPSLNRELHEVESYLSDDEFETIQRLSLSIIAGLTVTLDQHLSRQAT